MTSEKVASLMTLPLMSEQPHPDLPGVRVGQRDPESYEIIEMIQGVLNDTGEALIKTGHESMGHWAYDILKSNEKVDGKARSEALLSEAIKTFPAFRDHYLLSGKPVYLYKKALFMLQAIASTFANSNATFPLPSTDDLPVFCDNVLPTMALHFHLIKITDGASETLRQILQPSASTTDKIVEGVRLGQADAYALRSATVSACEAVVARAHSEKFNSTWLKSMTVVDLDGFLWAVAKDGPLRQIPRVLERGTCFY